MNTIAESLARQGLVARAKKRRKNLTRQDKSKCPFPVSCADNALLCAAAVTALPIVQMAARILAEMATFGDAGVSGPAGETALTQ